MFTPELREKAEALVDRYPVKRSALLPLLHLVQHADGYVSPEGITECAELLGLTRAEVGAVATFYTMYKREPLGRHLVSVCTNFSCKVRGGQEVYDRLSRHLGVGMNETTEDGAITLEHAECLGNCEGAPVVTVDYLNYEGVDPDAAVELVEAVRAGNPPQPTRGMIPPGIRAVQHRLAGIGPIDPDAPGQRLGLARAEHGAVPPQAAGPTGPGMGLLDLAMDDAQRAAAIEQVPDDDGPVSAGEAAAQAAPSSAEVPGEGGAAADPRTESPVRDEEQETD